MWQRGYIHLKTEAGDTAQHPAIVDDLLDHFVCVADKQRALRGSLRIESSTGDRRPSALLCDRGEGADIAWKEVVDRLLRCRRDIAQGVHANFQSIGRVSKALAGFPVEINERTEAPRFTVNDCDH